MRACLLLHDGIPVAGIGLALFGCGCGGLVGILALAVLWWWPVDPNRRLLADCALNGG